MNDYKVGLRVLCASVLLTLVACSTGEAGDERGFELALLASEEASARDVGLPQYPGSKPYTEDNDSSSGANVALSTPLFGLKVVATKLETTDDAEQVAAFYRRALAKFGSVLRCDGSAEAARSEDDDELTCEDHEYDSDTVVYKVGTKSNQRIVAIDEHGRGARFSLVHVTVSKE